ncbi:uncharacterized protein LOC26535038 [Drosophila yakuba]|uniref:ACP223 n=1 Tax=Drosophila yakuba TaxID=7245 RepID=Q20DH4_DROYA|nr:uncharacterized protein LOC26535038 [Drosophila yakuba]ABD64396.1 ACP223 [Drosophila yakuba]ABD64397.1 ACP223 [Drosophila yakuba]ABD64398.1 ACP223 [Drosophila yakuba]ABD64400.1 ACP223 [Drosophila yakuba]ABD64401.1 ACP223 [Drosophila yakuba]
MKGSLALVFLFLASSLALSSSMTELEMIENEFLTDCAKRENVSVDGISEYLMKRTNVEYKTMCALSCYFQISPGIQFVLGELKNEYGLDSCNTITRDDECEEGFKQIECYFQKFV